MRSYMKPLKCFSFCRTEITLGFNKIGLCKLGVFWTICPKILNAVTSTASKQLLRSYSTRLPKMYSCFLSYCSHQESVQEQAVSEPHAF